MAWIIYSLCALTAALCAYLLLGAYGRRRYRLLLWSGLCFVGLAVNNAVLVVDKLIVGDVDLSTPRALISLGAMSVLLYGLIWDVE
jgi:hypothetical protein